MEYVIYYSSTVLPIPDRPTNARMHIISVLLHLHSTVQRSFAFTTNGCHELCGHFPALLSLHNLSKSAGVALQKMQYFLLDPKCIVNIAEWIYAMSACADIASFNLLESYPVTLFKFPNQFDPSMISVILSCDKPTSFHIESPTQQLSSIYIDIFPQDYKPEFAEDRQWGAFAWSEIIERIKPKMHLHFLSIGKEIDPITTRAHELSQRIKLCSQGYLQRPISIHSIGHIPIGICVFHVLVLML